MLFLLDSLNENQICLLLLKHIRFLFVSFLSSNVILKLKVTDIILTHKSRGLHIHYLTCLYFFFFFLLAYRKQALYFVNYCIFSVLHDTIKLIKIYLYCVENN